MSEVLIYKGIENRKTYIVGDEPEEVMKYAKKKFKKPSSAFQQEFGIVVGDDLYLDDPQMKDQKTVWVVYTK